jgi:hypothetical protein
MEPAYTGDAKTDFRHSWVPYIFPFIEEQAVYDRYRFDKNWQDALTNSVITRRQESALDFAILLCPSTDHVIKAMLDYGAIPGPGKPSNEGWVKGQNWSQGILIAVANRIHDGTQWRKNNTDPLGNSRIKVSQVTDGTTYTILLGECAGRDTNNPRLQENPPVPDAHPFWADGDHAYAHHGPLINITPVDELYSRHPGGLHMGMADASVRFLEDTTPDWIIDALATRSGAETFHGEL